MKELHILVIDDEQTVREEIAEFLEIRNFTVFEAGAPSSAFKVLEEEDIDVIILDIKLPEMDGIEVLKKIKHLYPEIEVIMITGHGDADLILQALREGAFDFFHKPLEAGKIDVAIRRTGKFVTATNRIAQLEKSSALLTRDLSKNIGDIVGKSPVMQEVLQLTIKAAESRDTAVLITGPNGSGKELIARAIHYASPRKENIYHTVNCSAIPENLIESEFFGYKKGAFTGAHEDRPGYFEVCSGGTLFLDEIGDMPLIAQAKILRVLEDGKVKRIGECKEKQTDVRILAATNKDIKKMISQGLFREDLYYRLSTIEIKVPSLTERIEDIPLLIEHYTAHFAKKMGKEPIKIDPEAVETLKTYGFPGNVRELKNMIERAVILSDNNKLIPEFFPLTPGEEIHRDSFAGKKSSSTQDEQPIYNLAELEKKTVIAALDKTAYHQTKAARLLGISINSLARRMQKYGIEIKKEL